VGVNVDQALRVIEDAYSRRIFDEAEIVFTDGMPVVWMAKWLKRPIVEKVSGPDLMLRLCERAAEKKYKIFLLGAGPGVAAQAAKNLEQKYPGLECVGTYSPPFGFEKDPEEMQKKVEEIVREIAIPKINQVIEYILGEVATQEDLEKLLLESGSVTSVFGRAGNVKAMAGDYNAEMVGAAAVKHAEQHGTNGSDPIIAKEIGAAEEKHFHGNISSEGAIGDQNGKIIGLF
jgi:hypothetical protein